MRAFGFILLTLLYSCGTNQRTADSQVYNLMDKLWQQKTDKTSLEAALGPHDQLTEHGVIYWFENSEQIRSGHFFDKNQKINEQFILLRKSDLDDFKRYTQCAWDETVNRRAINNTIYWVRKGSCVQKNLSYEFMPSLNLYEVRWKR